MKMKIVAGMIAALAFTAVPLMSADAAPKQDQKRGAQTHRGSSGHTQRSSGNRGNVSRGHAVQRGHSGKNRATHNRGNVTRQKGITRQKNTTRRDVIRNKSAVQNRNAKKNARRAHRRPHFSNHQRTRIRNYWRGHRNYHRLARVAFPIIVGSFVPRTYAIYDLPNDFYGYVPGYEGYKYIVVGDELLIIDPDTYEIVAVIPV